MHRHFGDLGVGGDGYHGRRGHDPMIYAGIVAIAVLGMAAAYMMGRHCESVERRLRALEEKAASAPKAHSHRTVAGIEDATAVVVDLLFEVEAEHARLESLRQILGAVRQGPYAYDSERPAGRRKE